MPPTWLRNLQIRKVSLVPRGANPDAHVMLYKSEDPPDPVPPDIKKESTMAIDRTKLTKEEVAYLDDLEAKVAKSGEPEPQPEPDPGPDPIPEAIQKMLDAQQAEITKAKQEAADAKEAARVEKEARERIEFAKVAETQIPSSPGTAQEKGNLLYELSKALGKEVYEKIFTLLKAGDEAIKKSLFRASGDDVPAVGTAYEKLVTMAKDKVQKGEAKTEEIGFAKAVDENPDLAIQYRAENRRAAFAE